MLTVLHHAVVAAVAALGLGFLFCAGQHVLANWLGDSAKAPTSKAALATIFVSAVAAAVACAGQLALHSAEGRVIERTLVCLAVAVSVYALWKVVDRRYASILNAAVGLVIAAVLVAPVKGLGNLAVYLIVYAAALTAMLTQPKKARVRPTPKEVFGKLRELISSRRAQPAFMSSQSGETPVQSGAKREPVSRQQDYQLKRKFPGSRKEPKDQDQNR